jgi:hypothetical protein
MACSVSAWPILVSGLMLLIATANRRGADSFWLITPSNHLCAFCGYLRAVSM